MFQMCFKSDIAYIPQYVRGHSFPNNISTYNVGYEKGKCSKVQLGKSLVKVNNKKVTEVICDIVDSAEMIIKKGTSPAATDHYSLLQEILAIKTTMFLVAHHTPSHGSVS